MKRPDPWKDNPKLFEALQKARTKIQQRDLTQEADAARRREVEAKEQDHAHQLRGFLRWQERQHQLALDRERLIKEKETQKASWHEVIRALDADEIHSDYLAELDAATARFERQRARGVRYYVGKPTLRPRFNHRKEDIP